jgi:hypothetical protein
MVYVLSVAGMLSGDGQREMQTRDLHWPSSKRNNGRQRRKTMRSANSFAAKTNKWILANNNVKPHIADMPFLQPFVTELEGVISKAQTLDSEQEVARKELADIIHRRQDLETEGEKILRRINSHLRASFGFTSDQLIQFGIAPRPRVTRRKKVAPPPEPVVQA